MNNIRVGTWFNRRTEGLNGCNFYRAIWPMDTLSRQQGFEGSAVIEHPPDLLHFDICVFQRVIPSDTTARLTDLLCSKGKVTIYDLDDDLLAFHPEWTDLITEQFDAFTVSTPHLGKRMARYGKPVSVLPNHIDTRFFAKVSSAAERRIPGLTIGLVGGGSHRGDWPLVAEALAALKADYPDITIVLCGLVPRGFIADKVIPWVRFEALPAVLRQIDIVLKPLNSADDFNHSKSACGALEAMAAARPVGKRLGGCVPVVSGDLPVYRGTVQHRHNGLLVRDGDWYGAVAELIENKNLRQKLAVQGLKWVKKSRSTSLAGPLLAATFTRSYL